MKNLPQEILNIICEYADVKCRNGRYMNQIATTDPRRDLLKNIARIKVFEANETRDKYYYWVELPLCKITYFPEEYNKLHYKYFSEICSFYYYAFKSVSVYRGSSYKIKLSGEIYSIWNV
jgi:hypothetical protein